MAVIERNKVTDHGGDGPVMLFAHGYGCDKTMWSLTEPAFRDAYRTVLYDLTGMGGSRVEDYDPVRHADLSGHADDMIAVCEAVGAGPVTLIGHSVSAMIGLLASAERPDLFGRLVMIAPSPCYRNDGDYVGGFEEEDLAELLDLLDSNYLTWADQLANVLIGDQNPQSVTRDLNARFCAMDQRIARHFARVTFLSDHRADAAGAKVASLVLGCTDDAVVPHSVGDWLRANMPGATYVQLEATGHCPHVTSPGETTDAIKAYLAA